MSADITADACGSLSILVFHPNSPMHRPDAHGGTRGAEVRGKTVERAVIGTRRATASDQGGCVT
ncbi:hypothetical protein ACJ7VE_12560 [Streptomyces sp. PB17]|uniref:hypothetical protein n=1 Tax=Streptomyces TaxID=1883 RepID=UPI0033D5C9B5